MDLPRVSLGVFWVALVASLALTFFVQLPYFAWLLGSVLIALLCTALSLSVYYYRRSR